MKKIALFVKAPSIEKFFGEKYFASMRKWGEVAFYDREDFEDKEYCVEFLRGANVIITSWGTPSIDKDMLDACPDLELVCHAGGTPKPILSDALIEKNIPVTFSAIALGEGVAETAVGFTIAACKGFFTLSRDTKNGLWKEHKNADYVTDIYDITVGVISGGFVGRHYIKLMQNFNVDILLYDPTMTAEQVAALGATKAELNEMLSKADVISVHAPSIPATAKMLNASNLPLIKDGAVLINTSRGAIIDEPALIEELKKGRFFACIDVTDPEPPVVENELRYLDNVVLTPHIAGAVTNGLKRVAKHVCEEMDRFYSGEPMRTKVDFSQLSKMA